MEQLLDPNIPIDLNLLNQATIMMYQQNNPQAIHTVESVTQRDDFITHFDKVLMGNYSTGLKYIMLTEFKKFVAQKWESLSDEQTTHYRNFIATFIADISDTGREPTLLPLANIALINILLYEWPNKWPEFIPNILSLAQMSPNCCKNTMQILAMLVEDFTDFADNTLTTIRQAEMHGSFNEQFTLLLPMIQNALSSGNDELIIQTLKSIYVFLSVIPQEVIFTPEISGIITQNLLPNPKFLIHSISIICASPLSQIMSENSTFNFFHSIINCLRGIFVSDDMFNIDTKSQTSPKDFIHSFITAITKYISPISIMLAYPENSEPYEICLWWLYKITEQINISEDGLVDFAELIEFWHTLSRALYYDLSANHDIAPLFVPLLSNLRRFLLSTMVQSPSNGSNYINDEGLHYSKYDIYSQESNIYNSMRESIVFLYHINPEDLVSAIYEKLEQIKSEWNPDAINHFSWAIGAIPGTITEQQEMKVIAEILQTFMAMNQQITNIEQKAVVTSAILHICSQYGQLISKHYELLKIVINKMVEFTQIPIEQVQTAAVQALLHVSRYSTTTLSSKQHNEEQSIIESMFSNIQQLISPLTKENVISMIEFFSYLINSVPNEQLKKEMASTLANIANSQLQSLCQNVQLLDENWYNSFIFIIDCNRQFVSHLYPTFSKYFVEISPIFLQIYTQASTALNNLAAYPSSHQFANLQRIKSAIIKIHTEFIDYCGKEKILTEVAVNPILNIFISDYANSQVKTPEILGIVSSTCQRITEFFKTKYDVIMEGILKPSLPFLSDYGVFPDIWPHFNRFLSMYFSQEIDFLMSNSESLMVMLNLLKATISHPVQSVAENGIMALSALISSVDYPPQTQGKREFFNIISIDVFVFIASVLIDGVHKFLFNHIMNLMRRLIQMEAVQSRANELFQGFCCLLPNRPPKEIHTLIEKMVELSTSQYTAFKDLIRNFLVLAKKYAPCDPAMYKKEAEEIELQLQEKKKVPGLVPDQDLMSESQNVAKNLANMFSSFEF
ncbi:hypothetical protein TRFO_33066 [Tritrichomonas foetus]|uniref:Exportin-1/Importin-beta-like domain-containing protein n=1 Tax=Tritrichomonas foetus TaxID=1144522 RepID=A0A1J4JMA7_9EUKA|nr:hypothetical protein TRFO_33066 [Tritrichomonas foetus]|eukprot:OHT00249.1 hypothetical protein TRFO_33066 [Tritrichomonas foetus]